MKQLAFYQSPPRADALPLCERPIHRVAEAPTACNVVELLSALVGGPRQIETAEALLTHFGSLRAVVRSHSRPETAAECWLNWSSNRCGVPHGDETKVTYHLLCRVRHNRCYPEVLQIPS